jgi:hypothetical protein
MGHWVILEKCSLQSYYCVSLSKEPQRIPIFACPRDQERTYNRVLNGTYLKILHRRLCTRRYVPMRRVDSMKSYRVLQYGTITYYSTRVLYGISIFCT